MEAKCYIFLLFLFFGGMKMKRIEYEGIILTKAAILVILANVLIACTAPGMYVSCFIGTLLLPHITRKHKYFWDAKGYIAVGVFFSVYTGFVFPLVLYLNWRFLLKPMTNLNSTKKEEKEENPSFEQLKMSYVSQMIQRKIIEANAKGCDFFEIDRSGKLSGYQNGKVDEIYDDTIDLKVTPGSYSEICNWMKDNIPELRADFTDKKLIISWM